MENISFGYDRDLESQETVLFPTHNPPRDPWLFIVSILRARKILIAKAVIVKKRSLPLTGTSSPTPSYSVLDTCTTGDGDQEQTEILKILPPSPEVSIEVHPDGGDDHNRSNIKDQRANIATIVKERDLHSLEEFGGVQGIAEALDTDLEKGIPGNEEDLCSRRKARTLSKRQASECSFHGFLLKSCNNYTILLLLLSAALSLAFGIKEEGVKNGCYDAVIILLAVSVLVFVPSMREFWHESLQKFLGKQRLSQKREMLVEVIRGGCQQEISISDVVFGDIVCLKRGYQVPADGLFIPGKFLELEDGLKAIDEQNPFLFYGSKVINGNGRMLVTCVGMNTAWGEMMNRVTNTPNKTPLQVQLDKVNTCIQIAGLIISILILIVSFVRFELGKEYDGSVKPDLKGEPTSSKDLMEAVQRIVMKPSGKISLLTTSLTTLLVGIVEGLPFVVTLAVTYINKKTLCDKVLAQDMSAFVTMGLVRTICIHKTGGLTLNPMEVHMCLIGEEFVSEDPVIAPEVLEAFCDGISTPVLIQPSFRSSTDDPVLSWAAMKFGSKRMEILKQNCKIVPAKEANSNDEGSGVLMRKHRDNEANMYLHWKEPATTILAMCSHYYDSKGTKQAMDERKMVIEKHIEHMHSKHLRTIAFAYEQTVPTIEEKNLTLIGVLGLKRTDWGETSQVMVDCRNAGVNIILVSEEDVSVLQAIAEKCGMPIPNPDEMVLKGEDFQNFTDEKRMEMVDRIVVMGNSNPCDRHLLVKCLKQKGNPVAVVGARTNETAALKEADVGIAMGTWSTKLARESSTISIWDVNFSFLVTIVRCGRCAYDNIRKYIQLELTMLIAGLLINTITTVSLGDGSITAIQLVWANLIVTVFGGWALLTELPTKKLMHKRPVSGNKEPLITKAMWRNIVTQAFYQATILVTFLYKGEAIPGINQKVSKTMIFNSFVLCQVFNIFNTRELDKKNVFKGIHQNHWFWVAVGFTVALQASFIEVASVLAGNAKLNCEQWAVCSLIGMVSWVIHWAWKCTSDFISDRFIGLTSMIPSAPLESEFSLQLELPLINGESTAIQS